MTLCRKIFTITAASLCLLWNLILFIFLISDDSGMTAAFCAASGIVGSGFIYVCTRFLSDRFLPLNVMRRRIIYTVGALAVCLVIMLLTPYSPAHDSYDMSGFLSTYVKNTQLSDYANQYLSFYGTNRICMYFYKPLVLLFGSVKAGATVSNIIFLLTAVFCISDIVYKKFGTKCGEITLFLLPAFVPYMMMSGPYIYPPSIFLASVSLCLFFSRPVYLKIAAAVLFGILMIMRPTAAAFWIIFMVAYLMLRGSRDIINKVCFVIVLVLVCLCTKDGLHNIMYATGMYPYPEFTNSAMQWTLEIGLRPQGRKTGKCTYSAISEVPFDRISSTFSELWDIYEEASDHSTYRIKVLNKQLNIMIAQRAADTILSDFDSFADHVQTKYVNMFRDEYKPYYYSVNIPDENFAENLYKNYEWRYFLSENVLLTSFAFACIVLCINIIIKVKKGEVYSLTMLCAALSVMAVFCAFVLLTEVGKRLIFDVYTPMCIIICVIYSKLINRVGAKADKDIVNSVLYASAGALFICSAQQFYALYNITSFKDCICSYMPDNSIRITLKEPIKEKGYMFWCPEGIDIDLEWRQNILIPLEKYDRQSVDLVLPDGSKINLTNYRQEK